MEHEFYEGNEYLSSLPGDGDRTEDFEYEVRSFFIMADGSHFSAGLRDLINNYVYMFYLLCLITKRPVYICFVSKQTKLPLPFFIMAYL